MAWNENTPEYQSYKEYPRITAGQIGAWFHVDERLSIPLSEIAAVVDDAKNGPSIILKSGDTFIITRKAHDFWLKLNTARPEEAEQQYLKERGFATSPGMGVVRS